VAFTIKEINSVNYYSIYIVVCICDPTQGETVASIWSSAFKNIAILYFADEDAIQGVCFVLLFSYTFSSMHWGYACL